MKTFGAVVLVFVLSGCILPVVDPVCALTTGFALSSSISNVTAPSSVSLRAQICDNAAGSVMELYEGTTKLSELSAFERFETQYDTFRVYTFTVSLSKADNGTRNYTARTISRGNPLVSEGARVVVNIP